MAVTFRPYTSRHGITRDYDKVREFLIEAGYCAFTYARWDWMTTHGYLDRQAVGNIGLWEERGRLVGLATFDCQMDETYLITLPRYEYLRREMILYASRHLRNSDGSFQLVISDQDTAYQDMAADLGYVATPEKEYDLAFYPKKTVMEYSLPSGFSITDMASTFDLYQYGRILWKGFNHELNGEGVFTVHENDEADAISGMKRPNVDLSLKIAVVAPDSNFCAYCGMWYDPRAHYAVVEPVATDPDYRKMGLGRAAVLEGIRRVTSLGAPVALVGSNQQFYFSIGFRPYASATKWRMRADVKRV